MPAVAIETRRLINLLSANVIRHPVRHSLLESSNTEMALQVDKIDPRSLEEEIGLEDNSAAHK